MGTSSTCDKPNNSISVMVRCLSSIREIVFIKNYFPYLKVTKPKSDIIRLRLYCVFISFSVYFILTPIKQLSVFSAFTVPAEASAIFNEKSPALLAGIRAVIATSAP